MMNPKTKQPALSPFLLPKPASEHPFYLGKGTENATQLSRCDSIELNGRIDTSMRPTFPTIRGTLSSSCCCLPNFGRSRRCQEG